MQIQKDILFPLTEKKEYLEVFKKVYYHLYSNSNVSRAEIIIKDLSKLLLYALYTNKTNYRKLSESNDANEILFELKSAYPNICDYFSSFELSTEFILYSIDRFNEINVQNAPAHILGDAFQSLIGPNLRGDKGQFFTPKTIVKSIIEVLSPRKNDMICDPACGTGGFLIESLSYVQNMYNGFNGKLVGIEKDDFLANTANAILEIYTNNNFEIINNNSLDITNESIKKHLNKIDIIATNPPFGSKIGVKDKSILKNFELGYSWHFAKSEGKWIKSNKVLSEQAPQILFLELCIKLLRLNGKLGIVLPEGIFGNKGLGYIWDFIKENTKIIGMIDCPRTTFQPSTDVKTNILFLEKTVENPNSKNSFKVAIAQNCGHDKRGRISDGNGGKVEDDFVKIGKSFNDNESGIWKHATITDKYYLVPRYCISDKVNISNIEFNFEVEKYLSVNDLVEQKIIIIKKGNEVGSEAYGTGDIPFIRTSDIINMEINYDPTNSISDEYYQKFKDLQKIKEQDILMVADGRYRIGKTAIILENNTHSVIQSHLKIIRILKKEILSAFELLYILNHPIILEQIKSLVFIQSTLGSIGNRLNELLIPIPKKTPEWKMIIDDFKNTLLERHRLLNKLNTVHEIL